MSLFSDHVQLGLRALMRDAECFAFVFLGALSRSPDPQDIFKQSLTLGICLFGAALQHFWMIQRVPG